MTSRILVPASFGICLTMLALSAGGQTTTSNASHAAAPPGGPNAAATKATAASTAPEAASSSAHQHHATAHHKTRATHKQAENTSPGSYREAAYRDALHQCVTGPAGQREGCLDNAIMRFGRT
jgi:hypothetical protein